MKRNEFVFDSVDLLYYKFRRIILNRGGSYIDSPKRLKNKKSTINPKLNHNQCLQYALTVALNYQNIEQDPQTISKIKPFIINMIGNKQIFHQIKKTGKSLNQIINQSIT